MEFAKALFIRVLKTWCQAFIGVISYDATKMTVPAFDWSYVISVATRTAIVCLIWNLAVGLPEVDMAKLLSALYSVDDEDDEDDEEDEDEDEDEEDDEEEGEEE